MKTRLLTTVLFMAASLSSFAQDRATLPKLKEAAGRVLDFMMEDDYQSLKEFTYPVLLGEISEQQYMADLKKDSKGDGFVVIHKPVNTQITYGPIIPFNGGHYSIMYYDYRVSIALEKPLKKEEEEATLARFKKDYEYIAYEPSDNSLIAGGRKPMVAISDNSSSNFWSFILDIKPAYAQNVMPDEVKIDLGLMAPPAEKKAVTATSATQLPQTNTSAEQRDTDSKKAAAEKIRQRGKQ